MAPHSPGAVVLGGNFIGLGVVRSLGRRGISVCLVEGGRSISRYSRYTTRVVAGGDDLHDLLLKQGRQHQLDGWVVFPENDQHVEMLSTNHRSLSSIYRLTVPPLDVTRFALDKRLTYQKASESGIATPWTVIGTAAIVRTGKDLPYPVILKPAHNHHFFPQTSLKALPVDSPADLSRAFSQMRKYMPADEILVQERIPGGGDSQYSFAALCKDGRAYATLVARRTRQYPVDFGSASSFVETVSQPVVESDGRKFLESIGFDGMAEVEFKYDLRDGRHKILDFNPRPWGWHALGRAAGIDFPYLLYQQKIGREVLPMRAERKAAWFRELNDFLAIAKSSQRTLEIKRLAKAIVSGHFTTATFDLLDPIPFFAEFAFRASQGLSLQKKAKSLLTDS